MSAPYWRVISHDDYLKVEVIEDDRIRPLLVLNEDGLHEFERRRDFLGLEPDHYKEDDPDWDFFDWSVSELIGFFIRDDYAALRESRGDLPPALPVLDDPVLKHCFAFWYEGEASFFGRPSVGDCKIFTEAELDDFFGVNRTASERGRP